MKFGRAGLRLMCAAVVVPAVMALVGCAQLGASPAGASAAGQPPADLTAAANSTTTTTPSNPAWHDSAGMKAFEDCLRANGVAVKTLSWHGSGEDADDQKTRDAMNVCHEQLPDDMGIPLMDTDHTAMMQTFTACLRDRGVTAVPGYGGDWTGMDHPDIDSIDPATRAAMQACHNTTITPSPSST